MKEGFRKRKYALVSTVVTVPIKRAVEMTEDLIQWATFQSHSGKILDWKVECDALSQNSIDSLAALIADRLKKKKIAFGRVVSVPRGGRSPSKGAPKVSIKGWHLHPPY